MPQEYFLIQDTVTGLYLTSYSTSSENCMWGSEENALHFNTSQKNAVIASLGGAEGRFIGQNPKPR
jgi:hypothetical protein